MTIKDKLISNTTYLSLNWVFNTIFFMSFWILLGKTLSPDSYGMIAVALQVATFLSSLSLVGLGTTINKLIPELVERKRRDKIRSLISVSLTIVLFFSLIFSGGLIIFSLQFPNFLKLSSDVLWLVVVTIIVMTFANILANIHYGFQNMKKYFLTYFYGGLSMIIFALLFTYLGLGYVGAIIAFTLSYVVMFLTRLERNMFKISKKTSIDKKIIVKYCIPAFVVVCLSSILTNSQFIILSSMKTAEITGLFAVAMKITAAISIIPKVFSSALFPIISGLSVDKNSKSKQSYLISLVFRYSIFIVLPVAFFAIFFSKYIILFFSTAEYLSAMDFLPILVLGGIILGLANQFQSSLYAIGKPKKYRDSYVISSLVYLISAVILTYYFSARGLAISYLLSAILLFAITFLFIKKYLTINLPIKCIGKVLVGIAVSFLFLFFAKPLIPNFWVGIPFIAIAGIIYLVVLLKLNFYIEEDLMVLDFVAQRTPIFKRKVIWIRNYIAKFVNK